MERLLFSSLTTACSHEVFVSQGLNFYSRAVGGKLGRNKRNLQRVPASSEIHHSARSLWSLRVTGNAYQASLWRRGWGHPGGQKAFTLPETRMLVGGGL